MLFLTEFKYFRKPKPKPVSSLPLKFKVVSSLPIKFNKMDTYRKGTKLSIMLWTPRSIFYRRILDVLHKWFFRRGLFLWGVLVDLFLLFLRQGRYGQALYMILAASWFIGDWRLALKYVPYLSESIEPLRTIRYLLSCFFGVA